jgi:hypothetical protein
MSVGTSVFAGSGIGDEARIGLGEAIDYYEAGIEVDSGCRWVRFNRRLFGEL